MVNIFQSTSQFQDYHNFEQKAAISKLKYLIASSRTAYCRERPSRASLRDTISWPYTYLKAMRPFM